MKVFRGQAKNLKRNIKQNNMKPLAIVFGILVLITLTYTSTHSVMGVGNTMFKEGNGKRRVRRGRRGRQGFEGTTRNAAYRSGFREAGPGDPEDHGFEGGRSGFREDQCGGGVCDDDAFTGRSVSGFEGFSSAKNAAPLRQGFVGRRKQGFKGRMRRRREGSTGTGSAAGTGTGAGSGSATGAGTGSGSAVTTEVSQVDSASTTRQNTPPPPPPAKLDESFVGNRGRRRR